MKIYLKYKSMFANWLKMINYFLKIKNFTYKLTNSVN